MQIVVATREPSSAENSCRIVGVHSKGALRGAARTVERASGGMIGRARARGDFDGERGATLLLHEPPGLDCERVLLVGLGERDALDRERWDGICKATAKALLATGARVASSDLAAVVAGAGQAATTARPMSDVDAQALDASWLAAQLARRVHESSYRFDGHARRDPPAPPALERLTLVVPRPEAEAARRAVGRAEATAVGVARARQLADLAPNLCTPEHLAETARALAETHAALELRVIDENEMRELGMGALLAVARGSRRPPRLIELRYAGGGGGAPVCLVGKGITFDSGGISIKPSPSMDEMKYDMAGAAAVIGVIEACCRLGLALDVVGVVAAAENMPDGDASRPGDVIETLAGRSVEILNTDAEGRLVLCDALAWVERHRPAVVIDVATLTGACVVALGDVASGLFGNDQELVDALAAAGEIACDRAWQLPLWPAYRRQLESNFADLANVGGKGAGAVTAACFLAEFADAYPWAHLDIAGTAWHGGKEKGASGRPVALLVQYLCDRLDGAAGEPA